MPVSQIQSMPVKKKDIKQLAKELTEMKQRLSKIKQTKREELKMIECESIQATKDITEFRALINWVLDRMETKGKEYIEKRRKELSKTVENDIEECDEMIENIDTRLKRLKKNNNGECENSVTEIKKRKEAIRNAGDLMGSMKTSNRKAIVKFTVDPKVETFARNLDWFGKDRTYLSFEPPLSFPHLYKVKHENQFDIRAKGDRGICNVVSVCQLQNGTLLLADASNQRLKQLDVLYHLVEYLDLPKQPTCVAVMNENTALVALDGGNNSVLQLVETGIKLKLTDSFVIPKRCIAMACSNEGIFVATADTIFTYSLKGELLGDIYHTAKSKITSLALNSDMTRVHLMDSDRGLVTLDTDGLELGVTSDGSFKGPCCVTADSNDQIFTSGHDSHVISQFNHDMAYLGVVATGSTGFRHPLAIAFDRLHCRLVAATRAKNIIKVFQLK